MPRPTVALTAFRRRLHRLIADRFEGKYTLLAKRAGIPVSSMEHYLHAAVRLPGGEHLGRMAEALGVSSDFLLTGAAAVRADSLLSHPVHLPSLQGTSATEIEERQIAIPVFRCTCPTACPLTADRPTASAAPGHVFFPEDLLPRKHRHRLIALELDRTLSAAAWRVGTRVVVDWETRQPAWTALTLVHAEGRCRLGHVARTADGLLLAAELGAVPTALPPDSRILGRVVAVLTACREGQSSSRTGGAPIR
jgi:hypothetical protein